MTQLDAISAPNIRGLIKLEETLRHIVLGQRSGDKIYRANQRPQRLAALFACLCGPLCYKIGDVRDNQIAVQPDFQLCALFPASYRCL